MQNGDKGLSRLSLAGRGHMLITLESCYILIKFRIPIHFNIV